jgi:hypothetical protein
MRLSSFCFKAVSHSAQMRAYKAIDIIDALVYAAF